MDVSLSELRELDREAWRTVIHEVAKSQDTTELLNWTELNHIAKPFTFAIWWNQIMNVKKKIMNVKSHHIHKSQPHLQGEDYKGHTHQGEGNLGAILDFYLTQVDFFN